MHVLHCFTAYEKSINLGIAPSSRVQCWHCYTNPGHCSLSRKRNRDVGQCGKKEVFVINCRIYHGINPQTKRTHGSALAWLTSRYKPVPNPEDLMRTASLIFLFNCSKGIKSPDEQNFPGSHSLCYDQSLIWMLLHVIRPRPLCTHISQAICSFA